jgi:hypothetical protein
MTHLSIAEMRMPDTMTFPDIVIVVPLFLYMNQGSDGNTTAVRVMAEFSLSMGSGATT